MSIRKEVAKLTSITDAKEFSESVKQIIDTHIKKNPNSEIRMIKSFRKELNALVEELTLTKTKVINTGNSIIFPTEFTFILPLQKIVDLAVSTIEHREEAIKLVTRKSTLSSDESTILRKKMKKRFYHFTYDMLNYFTSVKDEYVDDTFKDEKDIENFIENNYIQKAFNRVGFEINIINSTYYTNPCTYGAFPPLHTIFLTGTSSDISKEELFLIPLGIMIYNDLSSFGKHDISKLGFSASSCDNPSEVFGHSFAYYIMDKMGIAQKHRFYNELHMLDMDSLNSDLKFIEDVLNQEPSQIEINQLI